MKKKWMMEQKWQDIIFIHFGIDAKWIKDQVPFELDLYENQAVISIVPFSMHGIRFPNTIAMPWISHLLELNLRTYVKVNGIAGVYFFTLETNSKLSEWIANKFFYLPYRYSKISLQLISQSYNFKYSRENISLNLKATIHNIRENSKLDTWATERYCLFTTNKNMSYRGMVDHPAWIHQTINLESLDNSFTKMITDENLTLLGSSYSKGFTVRFYPFEQCGFIRSYNESVSNKF